MTSAKASGSKIIRYQNGRERLNDLTRKRSEANTAKRQNMDIK